VDYVLNGATINNCTLNIDQGTVLAFTAPNYPFYSYEWGLRLNPGARLNVNGVPTNRVVFTRLEGIQEYPIPGWQRYGGPLITFKGVFLPSGAMVTPLPEARFLYADFPTMAGAAVHFGPLTQENPSTYDCVNILELNGCLLQGGDFIYEAGGPAGRSLTIHNTIFERSELEIADRVQPSGRNTAETLTAFNNLFYDTDLWLGSVAGTSGAGWTFTDNLFDNAAFHLNNGPVAVNNHNAYVNMATHLSPGTDAGPNIDLASLTYDKGALGKFYLATTATQLIRAGSRPAGQAALYHSLLARTPIRRRQGQRSTLAQRIWRWTAPAIQLTPMEMAWRTLLPTGTEMGVRTETKHPGRLQTLKESIYSLPPAAIL
jgi:hypothetical protein